MVAHVWAFPWLALLAGSAALLFACLHATLRSALAPPRPASIALGVVWGVIIAVLFLVSRHVGDTAGIDVIPARGVLLGALAGLALSTLSRSRLRREYGALAVFGVATVTLSAARLWLTHGEVSGLTAVALSAAATCLLLRVLPGIGAEVEPESSGIAITGPLYLATLAAGIELGFTRAEQLNQMYWPDLTLLWSGISCLSLLIASGIATTARRRHAKAQAAAGGDPATNLPGDSGTGRLPYLPAGGVGVGVFAASGSASDDRPTVTLTSVSGLVRGAIAALPILILLASAWWASASLMSESTAIKILTVGCGLWIVVSLLGSPAEPPPAREPVLRPGTSFFPDAPEPRENEAALSDSGSKRSSGLAILLAVVAVAVAHNYWAGYGVALLLLGGWTAVAALSVSGFDAPVSRDRRGRRIAIGDNALPLLSFGLVMALHRLLILQHDDFQGSTDSWGLLALAAGACLPFVSPFVLNDRPPIPIDEKPKTGSWLTIRDAAVALGATLALAVPVMAIGYLFATQSLANAFFGVALAALLTGVSSLTPPRRRLVLLNCGVVALFLLMLVPLASNWTEPTRRTKTELLAALAVAAVVAQVVATRPRTRLQEG